MKRLVGVFAVLGLAGPALTGCHRCGCEPTAEQVRLRRGVKAVGFEVLVTADTAARAFRDEIRIRAVVQRFEIREDVPGGPRRTVLTPLTFRNEVVFSCRPLGRGDVLPPVAWTDGQGVAVTTLRLTRTRAVPGTTRVTVTATYKGRYRGSLDGL